MELILENISKIVALTPTEERYLLSKTKILHVKSKTLLLSAGEISKHTYFVNSGIVRSFTISDNITENILHFACKGWWIGDMYSYISQKPSNLFIEVLDDAEIIQISKDDRELLFKEIPKLERFFRILAENSLVAHQERVIDNLSLTAEERFEKMCKKYPDLIHTVSQKNIASYIGVTPEFFSKMKSKLLKK